MMEMKVTIEKDASEDLQRLGLSLENFPAELRETGDFLREYTMEDVFTSAGAAIGESWPDLSSDYYAQKLKRFGFRPILVASGAMRKAFSYTSDNTQMVLGNPTPYFVFHQMGTRKMPQRMMLKLTESNQDKIDNIFQRGIEAKIAQAIAGGRPGG